MKAAQLGVLVVMTLLENESQQPFPWRHIETMILASA